MMTFRDSVRTIRKAEEEGRYEVTFRRKAAFYWVADGATETVAALQAASLAKTQVEVESDAATCEIKAARHVG